MPAHCFADSACFIFGAFVLLHVHVSAAAVLQDRVRGIDIAFAFKN